MSEEILVCSECGRKSFSDVKGTICGFTQPNKRKCSGRFESPAKPMTQEECENWIMLKGQTSERWFEVRILDEEVGQDPTMIALMETVSEMIFKGIQGMPFEESEKQRANKSKLEIVE